MRKHVSKNHPKINLNITTQPESYNEILETHALAGLDDGQLGSQRSQLWPVACGSPTTE